LNHRNLIASALALAGCPAALGAIVNELVPTWRGDANATYSGWDVFTSAYGGPNAPDQPGSSGASLFNFGPGAIITGGGNLYGSGGPLSIFLTGGVLNAPNAPLEVVLNVGTAGTFLDDASVLFTAITATGTVNYTPSASELRYDQPIPGFGATQTRAYTWDLSALPVTALGYQITFRSAEQFMSLTGVAVDIRFIPAPAAGVVLLAGLGRGRRRR
jgi:hypothetical protein